MRTKKKPLPGTGASFRFPRGARKGEGNPSPGAVDNIWCAQVELALLKELNAECRDLGRSIQPTHPFNGKRRHKN